MIKITSGNAENLVIAVATGLLVGRDYEKILIPAVKAALKTHKNVRLLLTLDEGLSEHTANLIWDDGILGMRRLTMFKAVAIVTDDDWITGAVKSLRYFLGYPVKAFRKDKLDDAKEWLNANNSTECDDRLIQMTSGWCGEGDTRTTNSSIPISAFRL